MLCGLGNAYAQNSELVKEIKKQAVEIDSLEKANKTLKSQITTLNKNIKTNESTNEKLLQINLAKEKKQKEDIEKLNKEIEKLNKEIFKLDNYTSEKKTIEKTLEAKNDSIDELKKKISEKDNEIKKIPENNKKLAAEEKEKGKSEVINQLVNTYTNKSFDELINSSSITSVQRDKLLIDNNIAVKQIIADLETYFSAKKLLSNKFKDSQVKNSLSQVTHIQQSKLVAASAAVVELKDNLDNFKSFNNGLNTAIQNIIAIDKSESVKGIYSEKIIKSKLNKILSELSNFIFVFNFNFIDYPHLSEIVSEIIKRKQRDPDDDISNLLSKIY